MKLCFRDELATAWARVVLDAPATTFRFPAWNWIGPQRTRGKAVSSLNGLLAGKVGLVAGIANERSIAAGCAQAFRDQEPSSCSTCREKLIAFVMPVAKTIGPRLLLPLDVEIDGALESVFDRIQSRFGRLDFEAMNAVEKDARKLSISTEQSQSGGGLVTRNYPWPNCPIPQIPGCPLRPCSA